MIGWNPWAPNGGPPEDDEDPELHDEDPEPEDHRILGPSGRVDPDPSYSKIVYEPDGPLKTERDELGQFLPGTSGAPQTMFRPGHDPRRVPAPFKGPGSMRPSIPFEKFELDHAIADRLRERLDTPDPGAVDRLTLFAQRMVDDALRGRTWAQKALLERLQPTRAKPRAEVEISGMVAHTVIVGPQGPEPEARPLNTYDVLPEPPQADEDD